MRRRRAATAISHRCGGSNAATVPMCCLQPESCRFCCFFRQAPSISVESDTCDRRKHRYACPGCSRLDALLPCLLACSTVLLALPFGGVWPIQRYVPTKQKHPSEKAKSRVLAHMVASFSCSRVDSIAQTDDVGGSTAVRQAQVSYFSNRYAAQPSVRRVSSLDEHY